MEKRNTLLDFGRLIIASMMQPRDITPAQIYNPKNNKNGSKSKRASIRGAVGLRNQAYGIHWIK